MGFLTRAARREESNENDNNEELYEKLFPKIGRDFIYREDFVKVLESVLILVDPTGLRWPNLRSTSEARLRALEYKRLLDKGKKGSVRYKDLINLDDDEVDDSEDNETEQSVDEA